MVFAALRAARIFWRRFLRNQLVARSGAYAFAQQPDLMVAIALRREA